MIGVICSFSTRNTKHWVESGKGLPVLRLRPRTTRLTWHLIRKGAEQVSADLDKLSSSRTATVESCMYRNKELLNTSVECSGTQRNTDSNRKSLNIRSDLTLESSDRSENPQIYGANWGCQRTLPNSVLLCPAQRRFSLGLRSGSMQTSNLEPNFGPVLKSSGSNFGSEPNYGIPKYVSPREDVNENVFGMYLQYRS